MHERDNSRWVDESSGRPSGMDKFMASSHSGVLGNPLTQESLTAALTQPGLARRDPPACATKGYSLLRRTDPFVLGAADRDAFAALNAMLTAVDPVELVGDNVSPMSGSPTSPPKGGMAAGASSSGAVVDQFPPPPPGSEPPGEPPTPASMLEAPPATAASSAPRVLGTDEMKMPPPGGLPRSRPRSRPSSSHPRRPRSGGSSSSFTGSPFSKIYGQPVQQTYLPTASAYFTTGNQMLSQPFGRPPSAAPSYATGQHHTQPQPHASGGGAGGGAGGEQQRQRPKSRPSTATAQTLRSPAALANFGSRFAEQRQSRPGTASRSSLGRIGSAASLRSVETTGTSIPGAAGTEYRRLMRVQSAARSRNTESKHEPVPLIAPVPEPLFSESGRGGGYAAMEEGGAFEGQKYFDRSKAAVRKKIFEASSNGQINHQGTLRLLLADMMYGLQDEHGDAMRW